MLFGVGVWQTLGAEKAQEFFAGYLLEQSLSVDNLFVFILVFRYFRAPKADQDKVKCLHVAAGGRMPCSCIQCVCAVPHDVMCRHTFMSVHAGVHPKSLFTVRYKSCSAKYPDKICYTMQVLSYGIGTAAILRLIMILLGSELIESWKPVLLLFAGILLFSSFKLLAGGSDEGEEEDLTDNGIVKLCR